MPSALILLVNDIPDQAHSYVTALLKGGYNVEHVASASAALAFVSGAQPDCAVIDLRLPDMSGWDLCRVLRDRADCERVRIVVLTPDVSRMAAADSATVGCHAWLAHPSVAEDLVRTVSQVLDLESVEPSSAEQALISLAMCPACGSERIRATLRVSPIQYYCCSGCRFCWRVDVLGAASSARH